MGRGANDNTGEAQKEKFAKDVRYLSWKEIKESNKWIVIDGTVYNIEEFSKVHPGGQKIIMNHVTQDATVNILELSI
jgi:cytochrome b involved in lipid metabolism